MVHTPRPRRARSERLGSSCSDPRCGRPARASKDDRLTLASVSECGSTDGGPRDACWSSISKVWVGPLSRGVSGFAWTVSSAFRTISLCRAQLESATRQPRRGCRHCLAGRVLRRGHARASSSFRAVSTRTVRASFREEAPPGRFEDPLSGGLLVVLAVSHRESRSLLLVQALHYDSTFVL